MTFKILEELQVFRQGPPSHVGRIVLFFFQGHLVLAVPMGEREQEGCREKTWMNPPRICWIKFLHLDIIVVPLCWDFLPLQEKQISERKSGLQLRDTTSPALIFYPGYIYIYIYIYKLFLQGRVDWYCRGKYYTFEWKVVLFKHLITEGQCVKLLAERYFQWFIHTEYALKTTPLIHSLQASQMPLHSHCIDSLTDRQRHISLHSKKNKYSTKTGQNQQTGAWP